MVFDESLMPSVVGSFEGDMGAALALFMGKTGGVEEGVVEGVDDQGGVFDFGNAVLAATLDVIVDGVFEPREGSSDPVVIVDEVLDFIELYAGKEPWVEFCFRRHFCLESGHESVEIESIDPMGEVTRAGIEVAGDGENADPFDGAGDVGFVIACIFEGDVPSKTRPYEADFSVFHFIGVVNDIF